MIMILSFPCLVHMIWCPYFHTISIIPYFHIISILLRGSSQIPKMYRKEGRKRANREIQKIQSLELTSLSANYPVVCTTRFQWDITTLHTQTHFWTIDFKPELVSSFGCAYLNLCFYVARGCLLAERRNLHSHLSKNVYVLGWSHWNRIIQIAR